MSVQREVVGFLFPNSTQYIISMKWQVYEKYEIRDYDFEEEFTVRENMHSGEDIEALKLFESVRIKENITSSIFLLPGKYVTWFANDMPHNRVKHLYNPIEEGPNLLKRFLRLGHGNVPSRMILSFVNKYGALKDVEHIGTEINRGFVYPRYPLSAFKEYAKEAYYAKNLIQSISKGDTRNIRDVLKVVSDNILGGFDSVADPFEAIVDFGLFIRSWWDKVPEYFRAHLISLMSKDEADYETIIKDCKNSMSEDRRVPIAFFMPSLSKEFWEVFTALAPNDIILDYADKLISAIFEDRLWKGVQVDPVVEGSFLNEAEPTLSYELRPKSLLSAIWFLLYLDVTNQSVNYHSFCNYCGKKIPRKIGEKGYRENIYCSSNHRNYAYNRDMKGVIELGKAGASLNLIKEAYPRRSVSSIIKWLEKEGIGVAKK